MRLPFVRIVTPPCPACGSKDTTTGRVIRLAAGLGLGLGGSLLCFLASFIYPPALILIPFLFFCGLIMCLVPPLGKYCCLECDAYWDPANPGMIWRPKPPGL